MTTTCHSRGRAGYTLIELLTVIAIIAALATIAALFFPNFQDRHLTARGADLTVQWLLTAKQQAKRDGLPTGIRFTLNGTTCNEMQYIQQPDDFAQGLYIGRATAVTAPQLPEYNAQFQLPAGVTFGSVDLPVAVGDYLELNGGGMLHRITGIDAANSRLSVADATQLGTPLPADNTNNVQSATATTNYRIIPAPRVLPGEAKLKLPGNVIVDFNPNHALVNVPINGQNPLTRNVPVRGGFYEILFAPSGAVIGQGTSTAQIILWICDSTKDNSGDLLIGGPILATVRPRNGVIAAFQAASGSDPFSFCRDGKLTGL